MFTLPGRLVASAAAAAAPPAGAGSALGPAAAGGLAQAPGSFLHYVNGICSELCDVIQTHVTRVSAQAQEHAQWSRQESVGFGSTGEIGQLHRQWSEYLSVLHECRVSAFCCFREQRHFVSFVHVVHLRLRIMRYDSTELRTKFLLLLNHPLCRTLCQIGKYA